MAYACSCLPKMANHRLFHHHVAWICELRYWLDIWLIAPIELRDSKENEVRGRCRQYH